MPLATVYCKDPRKTSEITELVQALPGLVAKHLGAQPPADLTAEEVELRVQVGHPLDQNTKDLAIIIWANSYPEREQNIDERRRLLTEDVQALAPKWADGMVWVLLQLGSYEEWSPILAGTGWPMVRETGATETQ